MYAWCFPDTLFDPRILGKSATIESTSPTGARISLVARPDGIEGVRFRPDFRDAADPESKGLVEHLVGYAKTRSGHVG